MKVKVINRSPFSLPEYVHAGDAGMDLRVDFSRVFDGNFGDMIKYRGNVIPHFKKETSIDGYLANFKLDYICMEQWSKVIVPTGLFVTVPRGAVGLIHPRSGNSFKRDFEIANSPGTIDHPYTGEVGIILQNHTPNEEVIRHGDRVAQFILQSAEAVEWVEVDSLEETSRSNGGYGSTDKTNDND